MNDIADILSKYKSMNNNALLNDMDQLMRDITIIGQAIPDLNAEKQYDAKNFLSGVLVHIDNMIADITGQLNERMDDVDKVQKMSDACLAYLKPQTGKKD